MPDPETTRPWSIATDFRRSSALLLVACACLAVTACEKQPVQIAEAPPNPLASQLSGARLDAAKTALEKNRRDEALLLLVSALKADSAHTEALQSLRVLLAETRWHFPAARMDAGLPVEKLALSGTSLWASVSGGYQPGTWNATARWNLATPAVEAVLFPRPAEQTQALFLSPDRSKIIVQRGTPGDFISLLCDAETLLPIRNLGRYPESCSVAAVTTFSPDGLLIAYPQANSGTLSWQIADAATGEIIRSHEQPKTLIPLSAGLDRQQLNIHHADGTHLKIPVSPVEETVSGPATSIPRETAEGFTLSGTLAEFPGTKMAPIRDRAAITAFTLADGRAAAATGKGTITVHRLLPAAKTTGRDAGPIRFQPSALGSLALLAEGLTGLEFDEERRSFTPLTEKERRAAIAGAGTVSLPGLDFSEVRESILSSPCATGQPDAAFLLHDRISRASETRRGFLALGPEAPAAEPSSVEKIQAIFRAGDSAAIIAAVREIPAKDPAAAAALSLALDAEHPEWISAFAEGKTPLPPLLRKLATSRIAWLEGDKAGAISLWRDGFPDLKTVARSEDWDGWETVDFTPRFAEHFILIDQQLATFELPADASPERKKALAGRLLDPETARSIGRARHAEACLKAAQDMATDQDTATLALELSIRARELGAPPVPGLRAEATAYTTMELFPKAHETWISLITDQPLEEQRSSDYAEAAYLAFENGNGDQAMEILNTGLHRFPKDADYAYRAGWISLLTARWDRAHLYLTAGERTGFSEEKREKALAMLSIAASECGYSEDAAIYFQQLAELDPSWAEPQPPKAEGWPPELIVSLNQLAEPPKATPVMEDGPLSDLPPPDGGNFDPLAPLDPVPMLEDVLPIPVPAPEEPNGIDPNRTPIKADEIPSLPIPKVKR
ncbi:MAG: tetratricopeptide repeat protein [Akkermansiaceae bacterium]|nr:tetratricopeptide repeat protein [Akkermansiaceae bacterium]